MIFPQEAAYRAGREAHRAGNTLNDNPHPKDPLRKQWEKGWRKEEFDRLPSKQKLWVCSRSRCRSKWRFSDLSQRDNGDGSTTTVCPKCGCDAFYLRPLPV